MGYLIIKGAELLQLNVVNFGGKAGDFSNKKFWHYTSAWCGKSILENHCFYASDLSKMNDIGEKQKIQKTEGKDFIVCFSNSDSESIPLWYLYSGISGGGVRLGLTPGDMLKFLNVKDRMIFKANGKIIDSQDIDISAGWVYYRREDNLIVYKNNTYLISAAEYEKIREAIFIYEKAYPWEYEKEFRIVFHTKKNIKEAKLEVIFPEEFVEKFRIGYGPEYEKRKKTSEKKYLEKIAPINDKTKSALSINMRLLRNSVKSFVEELPSLLAERDLQEYFMEMFGLLKEKYERKE